MCVGGENQNSGESVTLSDEKYVIQEQTSQKPTRITAPCSSLYLA